jgi:hypothetical protein
MKTAFALVVLLLIVAVPVTLILGMVRPKLLLPRAKAPTRAKAFGVWCAYTGAVSIFIVCLMVADMLPTAPATVVTTIGGPVAVRPATP